jgi:formiminoglutamase
VESGIYLQASDYDLESCAEGTLGASTKKLSEETDLSEFGIALLIVPEYRGAELGISEGHPNFERKLFALSNPHSGFEILHLGYVVPGEKLTDTYLAVTQIVRECLNNKVLPIIIGGSQDLTFASYRAYEEEERVMNLVSVDHSFDLGDVDSSIHYEGYLNKIILSHPNYLYNFSNLGYQSYFVKPGEIELMNKLKFDYYRLGNVRDDMKEVEPVVRNADLLTFDMNSIKAADSPASLNPTPNGFYGEEACVITRYAGLSDKLTSIGFYNLKPGADNEQSAHLLAQMAWYFIEGFQARKNDSPVINRRDFLKYTVTSENEFGEIVFYKNLLSERWWMDVPLPKSKLSKYERHQLVPCSYKDYLQACNDEIPGKWLRNFEKFS